MTSNTDKPQSIFLADDDPDDRMLFEEALKKIDISSKLTIAHDGEDLMQILDKHVPPKPTVIFIDLNMPRKNGLECLKEIKQMPKFKDVPVVVYSTSCQKDSIDETYRHGASYYICKPDSFHKLTKSIAKIHALNWGREKTSMQDFIISF